MEMMTHVHERPPFEQNFVEQGIPLFGRFGVGNRWQPDSVIREKALRTIDYSSC